MPTLQEIRARLKEQEDRSSGKSPSGMDNAIYPFWNMKENEQASIRFLPDGNPDNTFFWVERLMIKLPFSGVKGDTDSRPIQVQVPCMEMYNETCPVLTEVRAWFKDPALEDMGRKYWKKRSYIFQGFVVDDPMKEDQKPENPIRRFIIGPQIFKIIKAALMDPDMEDLPTDYVNGVDFRLTKTSKGNYADYSTSNWARRERPLNDEENAAIETHGLFTLDSFLPKKPDETAVKVIKEMFEASVNGEPYDPDKWSQYFRPAGMSAKTGNPQSAQTPSTQESKPAEKTETTVPTQKTETADTSSVPFEPDEKTNVEPTKDDSAESGAAAGAQDILAMIRSRQNQ